MIFHYLLLSHLRKVCYPHGIPALTRSLGRLVLAVSSEVTLQCSHFLRQEMITETPLPLYYIFQPSSA